MTPTLTRKQQALYDHLTSRAQLQQHAPSLDELCQELGLASRGSLHKLVSALIEADLVEPMNQQQRGVRLKACPTNAPPAVDVPFMGYIAAGRPIEAVTQAEPIPVPADWLGNKRCYVLEVRGHSMIEDGILDGDRLLIESRDSARNGETVVALIDGQDATLKRLEARDDRVVLHPANSSMPPQIYGLDQVMIQGVLRALLRTF